MKIGPSGNLHIPLANGNIMKIPFDKSKIEGDINISEEVTKSGVWKQVNDGKANSEEKNDHKNKRYLLFITKPYIIN